MKKNTTKTAAALTFLLMVMLMTTTLNAQNPIAKTLFSANEISSLVNGINSDNEGLKKSSIYFAGKYKVYEAVDALTALLENEKDASVRLLTTKALFEIGDYKGMKAVYELSKVDEDLKVRRICKALYEVYELTDYENKFTSVK
jgi:HEAT repeat protein